jgi:predicted nucleic acid-binding protein
MPIPKVYLETSVFNSGFADDASDRKEDTLKLLEDIEEGKYKPYTSDYVLQELKCATDPKEGLKIELINRYRMTILKKSDEAEHLAGLYVTECVIPARNLTDGIHLALTAVSDLDFIVSFNFKHIVKRKTMTMTEGINIRQGYKRIGIHSPSEVIEAVNEPRVMTENHEIRELIYEATKDMTQAERAALTHRYAQEMIDKYGLKVKGPDRKSEVMIV